MDFSVPSLFNYLFAATSDQPLSLSQLQHDLDAGSPDQQAALDLALAALQKLGLIAISGDPSTATITRQPESGLVVGRLRCSSKGFCFAIRDEPGVEDIYIHGSNLQGAWNGDQVLARVTKDGNRRRSPEGEVAAVIERSNPTVVGRLKQADDGLRVVPLDDRMLFELTLDPQADQADPDAADGRFAYVEVVRYPLADQLPVGRIRKILGSNPETSMDIDLVCCRHDLPQSFGPDTLEAAGSLSGKVSKSELGRRQDFRDWLTVILDPLPLAQAHSPSVAVSVSPIDDEGWQLGVHIADAAYWIPADHPLDQEARHRGSDVYLDPSVVPMLPPAAQALIGLQSQQEKLTLSVLMDLAADGGLISAAIHPSVIIPRARLSYGTVQSLLLSEPIDGKALSGLSGANLSDLIHLFHHLQKVAQLIAQQRHQQGGIDLPQPPLHFSPNLAESREGVLLLDPQSVTQRMMAEFTVLTQRVVGTHLRELGIPALYLTQSTPTTLQNSLRLAANLKLIPDANTSITPELWQQLTQQIQDSTQVDPSASPAFVSQLLGNLPKPHLDSDATDPHFGLGIPMPYAPIVDPGHNYAALVNQRALQLAFSKGRDRRSSRVKEGVDLHSSSCHGRIGWKVLPPKHQDSWAEVVQSVVDPLNQQQQQVAEAEKELIELKKSQFMQEHLGQVFGGLIVGTQNYGFFVSVDPIQAEGLVHVSSLKTDWYEYWSSAQALVGRKSRRQYRLGDRVEVRIKNVDYYRRQIDLEVVSDGILSSEDESSQGSQGREIYGRHDSSEQGDPDDRDDDDRDE